MGREKKIEIPGGASPDIPDSVIQTPEPQPVVFSVSTATKEQILEHFSGYRDAEGENIILDADFSDLVELALKPQRIEAADPAVADNKAPHRAPVLTDKGWVV
ncbi:TPA: hypothetical protein N3A33_004781 [Salmonella enterica subsp. salamae serovar 28:r:e,n,z15]|nr:hypothetical protein [Salmonella enterica subsp. salamae serovar 28:r:e,n,z15]